MTEQCITTVAVVVLTCAVLALWYALARLACLVDTMSDVVRRLAEIANEDAQSKLNDAVGGNSELKKRLLSINNNWMSEL